MFPMSAEELDGEVIIQGFRNELAITLTSCSQQYQFINTHFSNTDGTARPFFDQQGTNSEIDYSNPCDAIELIGEDIKKWTAEFIEAVTKNCGKKSCYTPIDGALKNIETHKKWHKRNLEWIKKTNESLDKLIARFKTAQKCKYCIVVTSSKDDLCNFPGTVYSGMISNCDLQGAPTLDGVHNRL